MFDLMPVRKRAGKEVARLRDEIDNLFNRFFDMDFPLSQQLFGEGEWMPRLDISEGKGEITVKAEVPGCEAEDIEVKIEGRTLTISGEKKQEKEEKDENFHRVEQSYGAFRRSVKLPSEVNQEDVSATCSNGILKLVFKKTEESEAKKIAVKKA